MKQAAIRWTRRLLVLGACVGLLAALLHTPWARDVALRRLMSALSARTGLVFSAEALDYNLFRLTAAVDGLQISRAGSPAGPILRVRQARFSLSHRALTGAIEADRVEADGLALVIDLTPRAEGPAGAKAPSEPFRVPVFVVGRAVVRHADVDFIDPDGLGRVQARDATLELDGSGPRRLEGPIVVAGGLTLTNEHTRVRIDRLEARAFLDGDTIGVRPASAAAGGHRVAFDGSMAFTGPSPEFDLGIAGDLDAAQLTSWFPAMPPGKGLLQFTGRVTGALSDPLLRCSVRSTGLTLPDLRVPASTAEGRISKAGIYVDRLRTGIGAGWIDASGRLPLGSDDPNSRFSVKWENVSVASLAQVFTRLPTDPIGIVSTGSAHMRWPGTALRFDTLEGDAESEVHVATSLPPARVSLRATAGMWKLHAAQELDGRTSADLDTAIAVDPADITQSQVTGAIHTRSGDLRQALAALRRGFPSLPETSAWLAESPLTVDGSIDGTLGTPHFSGTAASERLRLDALPVMRASVSFEATPSRVIVSKATGRDDGGNVIEAHAGIDVVAGTTGGDFTAHVTSPEPIVTALLGAGASAESALKARGSVLLAGTWEGPLDDPVVAMTITAQDLAITKGGVSVEHVAAEGRVAGSISNPEATVHVRAGAVRTASVSPVPADATLSLRSGRLDLTAHVPDWSAALDGHIAAAAPHDFSATLSIAGLTGDRLQALVGSRAPGYATEGTISARIDAAGNLGSRTLHLGGRATLVGGGISAGERRLLDGIDAGLETGNGRLWLTRFAGRALGGPISASGDLPLRWIEEYLPEGWRLDEAPVSPKPASFALSAEPDVKVLGAWLRPEEPGQITGALRLRMSGSASAPSLQAVEGRVVVEPDTVTVRDVPFTLSRGAEVLIRNGQARVDHFTVTAPGTTASVTGSVGLTGDEPVDAAFSVSGALGFLSSLVPGRLVGHVEAALTANGTAAEPRLSGKLSLENAAWVWPEQRLSLRDWSGSATLASGTLTIDTLAGRVNGGEADVSGAVTFGGTGGAGLTLRVRDAYAEVVKGFRSQADADLRLTSSPGGGHLSGTITVTSGAYREPVTSMARLFSTRASTSAPATESSFLKSIDLDVALTAASPIIIENSAGRLDLVPSLKLKGSLATPVLFGSLDMIDQGRLTVAGRSFKLSEARVVFSGTGDPSVRMIGETRIGDYDVTLRTQGPVTDMQPTYTSEPPLSERDVQSLLVTGRPADITSTKSSADEQFVLGAASSDLLGVAGQMVGLDTVQLGRGDFELGSSDVNPATRLTVTKSINARSSLVLSQDLDNNKFTWIVVLVPKRGYEVRLSERDNTDDVIEFRQELMFGPGVSPPSTSGFRKRTKGPRVEALTFTGEPGFPVSDLESAVKLKPPKEFDAGTWQEDRARLEAFYRDRGFATARIVPNRAALKDGQAGRIRLEYRIDPGPHTLLTVSGIDLSARERRALMRSWSRSVLPEFVQEDLARELRDALASRGHLRPAIAVTLETPRPETILANAVVTPGPVTTARRLTIEGARAVPEPELRAALSGNPALDTAWVDPVPLVEAVVAFYAGRGYPSARVVADDLAFDGDTAERRLRVSEGPQAVVADVVLAGVGDSRADGARSAVGLRAGQPVLPGTEADASRRLQRFYLDGGFRSAAVKSSAKAAADGRTTLFFTVVEGPQSVVSAIAVTGLDATKPSVADGAITLKPGEPAGQQAVSDTQKKLYGLGVFRSADVSFEPATQAETTGTAAMPVNVVVSLEEARRFQLRYGVQLSNQYGPVLEDFTSAIGVAGDIRDRNFLGRAFTLGASGRYEKNLQSLRAQFSLPAMLNQRLQTNFYGTVRSETDTSGESLTYTDKERDFTFEQRMRLPHRMEVSWGYSFNLRDVTFDLQPRFEPLELKGALGTLNGTFIYDARDKPFNASRGWFQSSNMQWGLQALGSDFDYVRVLLRQFYYKTAGPFIFASGLRVGILHGISGSPPITILDRFFDAGGAQTVRGYAEDSLSAVEISGSPVGGTRLLLLNQEVRFPLFSRWLQGAAFIDAGNTFSDPENPFKPSDTTLFNKLALGAGFGIRIMTPFAPIRIDVGYPLDRRPQDRPYRVYFSIGQIF